MSGQIRTDGIRGPSLAFIKGPKRGTIIPLVLEETLIGRIDTSHIEVDDPSVSRVHARVDRRVDGFYLVDLDSTGGTLVNGQRINDPRLLVDGDEISVGEIGFIFQLSPHPRSWAA